MPILTKSTEVFFVDPSDDTVVKITYLTSFNPGAAPSDQIDITTLDTTSTRQYLKGLRTPGQASGTILATMSEASHETLFNLGEDGQDSTTHFCVAFSDGVAPPTVDTNGDFVFPTTRTFIAFDAYVSDFPLDFQINDVVKTNLTLQRTGGTTLHKKTP